MTRNQVLEHCVLASVYTTRTEFNWVDVTYKTLCDLGIATPCDDYVPDKNNTDFEYYEKWRKNNLPFSGSIK